MPSLENFEDRTALLQRLFRLSATAEARWGRMPVGGMVCHLDDAFRSIRNPRGVPDHSTFRLRTLVKFGALYWPRPWPEDFPTVAEMDQEGAGTRPADFAKDRKRLAESIEAFANDLKMGGRKHPQFGKMTQSQWMRWGWLHTDHHLRQFGR